MSLLINLYRPIGVLGTSRLYKIQGQIYAFTPHFMDNNEFYINSDPDYLVSEFESELSFTKENWYYPGRPTMVVVLSHALLGSTKVSQASTNNGSSTKNILHNSDVSKRNLLNFFTNLRGGISAGGTVRVKLCRIAETINTSNIESLDFLIEKPEVNWSHILRGAYASRVSRKKLGYNESKTQASTPGSRTPGHRTPGSRTPGSGLGGRTPKRRSTTFHGKSLASPLEKLHDENYFDELANALSKLKANAEPQFKLKDHKDKQAQHLVESPSGSLSPILEDQHQQKTGAVPYATAGDHQTHSPQDMLSLTLGDPSQFYQAVENLSASVNLYDQIGKLKLTYLYVTIVMNLAI